jgi:hypothetical protein
MDIIEALPSVYHFCNFLGSEQVSANLAEERRMLKARLDGLHDSITANLARVRQNSAWNRNVKSRFPRSEAALLRVPCATTPALPLPVIPCSSKQRPWTGTLFRNGQEQAARLNSDLQRKGEGLSLLRGNEAALKMQCSMEGKFPILGASQILRRPLRLPLT